MYKKILLAYDGSDAGQKALLDCRDVAQWSNAELHLVAVMPSAMSFPPARSAAAASVSA